MPVYVIAVKCGRCRSTVELEMRVICDLDDKFTFLCPVCGEGEMEYRLQLPNAVTSSEREAVLAMGGK